VKREGSLRTIRSEQTQCRPHRKAQHYEIGMDRERGRSRLNVVFEERVQQALLGDELEIVIRFPARNTSQRLFVGIERSIGRKRCFHGDDLRLSETAVFFENFELGRDLRQRRLAQLRIGAIDVEEAGRGTMCSLKASLLSI
jgi:hypothetical protein